MVFFISPEQFCNVSLVSAASQNLNTAGAMHMRVFKFKVMT